MSAEIIKTRPLDNYASPAVLKIYERCNLLADKIEGIRQREFSNRDAHELAREAKSLMHHARKIQSVERKTLIRLDPSGQWNDGTMEYSLLFPPPFLKQNPWESRRFYEYRKDFFMMNHLIPWAERLNRDVHQFLNETRIAENFAALENELAVFKLRFTRASHEFQQYSHTWTQTICNSKYYEFNETMQRLEKTAKITLNFARSVRGDVRKSLINLIPNRSLLTSEELDRIVSEHEDSIKIHDLVVRTDILYNEVKENLQQAEVLRHQLSIYAFSDALPVS